MPDGKVRFMEKFTKQRSGFAFLGILLGNRKSIAKDWNARGLGVALFSWNGWNTSPDRKNVLSVLRRWVAFDG
jgi:hypothetical protein